MSSQSSPSRPTSACSLPTRVPGGVPESWKFRVAFHCLLPAWASRRSSRNSGSLSLGPPFQGEQGHHLHLSSLPMRMLQCPLSISTNSDPQASPHMSPPSPHFYILCPPFPNFENANGLMPFQSVHHPRLTRKTVHL